MKKNNFIIIILVVIGVLGYAFVEGYIKPRIESDNEKYYLEQREPLTHDFSSVLKYKNRYMGNASNLINLNYNLPLCNIERMYQLYPKRLTAEINYKVKPESINRDKLNRVLVYNSTANFVLIDNMKVLKMNFIGASYTITRASVEKWYCTSLKTLRNEKIWKNKVQSKLVDKDYVAKFIKDNVIIK